MKIGFKIDFFITRMCFGKFGEQQKKFWDTIFFILFLSKSLNLEGGGGSANLEKLYILNFFWDPSHMAREARARVRNGHSKWLIMALSQDS